MSKTIGIDLGTTNSCAAVYEGGEKVIIPSANGGRTTPSVVAFGKDGQIMVGEVAKRQAAVNPDRTFFSIKRDMGSGRRIKIDGKIYSPEEISAMILRQIKKDAEKFLGETVTDAVITVPAYFTDAQRQATKDAGTIAGLNVLRIINEPTSAALAYGCDKEESQKVMVYDLGGGTLDVSILDINTGLIEVLATSGNNHLGGDDFDACVADWIVSEFKKTNKVDLRKDTMAYQRVKEAAEAAKISLSAGESAQISLPYITTVRGEQLHLEMTLTRDHFDMLTKHLVNKTLEPVKNAMADAHLSPADINKVLLVGGSTRMIAVQQAVRGCMGKEPFKGINPDECVAMGACLQGGVMSGTVTGLILMDVTPLTLGIETVGGVCTPLIDRNSVIPVTKSKIFTTAADFQSNVEINVLQGERRMARENKSLGKFVLKGIRRERRGVPQIEVTFNIDANGIVNVSAKDLGTGKSQEITISGSGSMSRDEVDRAVFEAKMHEKEDGELKDRQELEGKIESLIYSAQQSKKGKSFSEKRAIDEKIKNARKAIKSRDLAQMNAAAAELEI